MTTMSIQPLSQPQKKFLKDYSKSTFEIDQVHLHFAISESFTVVTQKALYRKVSPCDELVLDGSDLELLEVKLNEVQVPTELRNGQLVIKTPNSKFALEIKTRIYPNDNTSLEGLYKISQGYLTQCEPEGFRRITYFLDRPDVMTSYVVTIEANAEKFPVLLSNGNLVSSQVKDGVKTVVWEDPHKKPSYLFALVAGEFEVAEDHFVTCSGRRVQLQIYVPKGQVSRTGHCMESLKKAMQWDEVRYGREYDLDLYMIVSTDDFNAGAMENKGLNIFNSRLVLADSKTATDQDYFNIESVVAHEYFHNWTGNRVTLRDWFHLSLKEGLTVFRDQEFSMDQSSPGAIRIDSVGDLRSSQFAEDAGPNAHPIRPTSCFAVDNFFTSTIYEKGSEVIRMMQTMVGRPGFRKGMDLYFERFDEQAVTIEDFAKSISDANAQDWEQFKLWYSQAGTPVVEVETEYNAELKTYSVHLKQSCPLTAQESIEGFSKKPFHIPLVIGLLDKNGQEMSIKSSDIVVNSEGQSLIHLKSEHQTVVIENIKTNPTLSINRFFSAPIHLKINQTEAEKIHLLKHDSDAFNRWESSQNLLNSYLLQQYQSEVLIPLSPNLLEAYKEVLTRSDIASDVKASLLTPSDASYLIQLMPRFNAKKLSAAFSQLRSQLSKNLENEFLNTYDRLNGLNLNSRDPKDFADRRLKNRCLYYLAGLKKHQALTTEQFRKATIMTDLEAAFSIILNTPSIERNEFIESFYDQWKSEYLVINKWFALIATSDHPSTFNDVLRLSRHPDFNIRNPNRVYSLLWRFGDNIPVFHNEEYNPYGFFADKLIEIDKLNPNVAARLAGCFDLVTKLEAERSSLVRKEIDRVIEAGMSSNTYEIIKKQKEALE